MNDIPLEWIEYLNAPINSLHPKAFVNKHSAIKSRRVH